MMKCFAFATALLVIAPDAFEHSLVHAFQSSHNTISKPSRYPQFSSTHTVRPTKSFDFSPSLTSRVVWRHHRDANQEVSTPNPVTSDKSALFKKKTSNQSFLHNSARSMIRKLRRTFTIILASFAFFLSSARVHSPPSHAASLATATSTSSVSWTQKLNPFRTRTADEMIDAYVRDRLFADDEFDPVESAYREAYADAGRIGDGSASSGVYPSLLAETAGAALGRKDVSSLVSKSRGDGVGASAAEGKGDGITAILIKSSDFLQRRLRVSASVSYYIIAGGGLLGLCVLPGTIGVLYQSIQRLQIDKSEMRMYGQISDMDATARKETDDDDDDDDE